MDKGSSIKITREFKDFLENLRSTRRSKVFGIDKELLSQKDTCDLITKYFKLNNERFVELMKLPLTKLNSTNK